MRWCIRHYSKVHAWCMQVPFIWLIFCGQMYEPSKRKSDCNYRKSSELQPVIKIQLFRKLFLYCSLRRKKILMTINKLVFYCKNAVNLFEYK